MSAPLWTSRAELRREPNGDLVASNGGWMTESGTVDGYVFRFVKDNVWGDQPVPPARETHDQARARLAASSNRLVAPRPGVWTVECYAVTFSGAWGSEPAWAEWGGPNAAHRDDPSTYPNRSAAVTVTAPGPEPAPEPTPAPPAVTLESAQAKASAALYELVEEWRRQGTTDAQIRGTLVYLLIKAMASKGALRTRVREALKAVLA